MWKIDFLDRLDSGERIDKMFEGILIKPWGKGKVETYRHIESHMNNQYKYQFLDLSMTIIGCLPSVKFLHHLNMSMIFQETIVKIGRPEFFLLILPKNYLVSN